MFLNHYIFMKKKNCIIIGNMQRRINTPRVLPRTIQYAIINELRVLTLYNPSIYNVVLIA